MTSTSWRWRFFLRVLLLSLIVPLHGQDTARKPDPLLGEDNLLAAMHSISTLTLLDRVKELSSEKYGGRLTGTSGYADAAAWAADSMKKWNLKPGGDKGSWLQSFGSPYTLVLPGGTFSLRINLDGGGTITKSYVVEDDYYPGSDSDGNSVTAEVIYAGYGITAPDLNFDEYGGIDAKGKVVLVEPETPVSPDREADEFKRWRPYSSPEWKARNAREHGAAGMIFLSHAAGADCGFLQDFAVVHAGPGVVEDIFAGTGKKHDALVDAIGEKKRPVSFATGKTVTIKNNTEYHPDGLGANVIGYLEGKDPALKNEAILIGAHLDGLGRDPMLMPGANDNASGAAVVLGVAEALGKSALPLKRSVVFALFGAGEQCLKGSEYYLAHPWVPNEKVKGFVGLEMVGRGESIYGAGGKNFPQFWDYFARGNRKYIHRPMEAGFEPDLGRPRQDAALFAAAGIPAVSIGVVGGAPLPDPSVHTSRDTVESLTPDIMADLARLVFMAVIEAANK